jgi:myo-inositol catabolism protein IolH
VKLAVDPYMLRKTPLLELPALVAELGYQHIELSPREDFIPFFVHPRADRATIAAFRKELAGAGVEIASVLPLYKWSGPDEDERQAAVRYWRRAIQITVDLGCDVMNSEFNGRPEQAAASEAQFWRSMEELLPVFEQEGVRLVLEPHPDDFMEDGRGAVDLIRGIDNELVTFLYCAPHTFHQGGDLADVIRYAGPLLIHQHLDVGQGEVDWDLFFATLAEVGFDGIATVCVFAWEERARESLVGNREKVQEYLGRHAVSTA